MMSFRYASASDYADISRFLDEQWAKDHIYVRSRALFDWTFARARHWDESAYCFALAEDRGRVAGILGGIPFTMNVRGERTRGVWIVNYAMHPDYRKGPAAMQLMGAFRRDPFRVCIAAGLNPATAVIYRVLRGQILPELPRYFGAFPNAIASFAQLLRLAHPEWTEAKIEEVASAFLLPRVPRSGGEPGRDVPAAWDEVDWPAFAERTAGAARDAEYLDWRYRKHPCFEYRFVTVPDGPRTGLAVWRLESIRQTSGTAPGPGQLGRIVEMIPASSGNAEALLAAVLREIEAAGALGADFYGYCGEARLAFEQAGFRLTNRDPDGAAIPSRFQPLDAHGSPILNAMFALGPVPEFAPGLECVWYWTKSDSDQDRPN